MTKERYKIAFNRMIQILRGASFARYFTHATKTGMELRQSVIMAIVDKAHMLLRHGNEDMAQKS